MEIGMLNFLSGIIGHCTDRRIAIYLFDFYHTPQCIGNIHRKLSCSQGGFRSNYLQSLLSMHWTDLLENSHPLFCNKEDYFTYKVESHRDVRFC